METQNLDLVNANPANLELENVEPETANANPPNPEQENVETQNLENGFPVLPFVIDGNTVLVSGIVVIAVFVKRRKGKAAKP